MSRIDVIASRFERLGYEVSRIKTVAREAIVCNWTKKEKPPMVSISTSGNAVRMKIYTQMPNGETRYEDIELENVVAFRVLGEVDMTFIDGKLETLMVKPVKITIVQTKSGTVDITITSTW